MILYGIIPATILLVYLIICSFFDIRTRTLPKQLMITGYGIIGLGIALGLMYMVEMQDTFPIVCVGISVIIFFFLMSGNAYMLKTGHSIIIGGADIVVFTAICCISPYMLAVPNFIVIALGAFLLSTLVRLIPKVNEDYKKRGIPYIPYMAIVWLGVSVLPFCLGFTYKLY